MRSICASRPWLASHSPHLMQIIELERRAAAQGTTTRGSAFSSWANLDIAPEDMYFVDSRGDRNNLVYGALYRADVAAYHRTDPCGIAKGATYHGGRHFQRYTLYLLPPSACSCLPVCCDYCLNRSNFASRSWAVSGLFCYTKHCKVL